MNVRELMALLAEMPEDNEVQVAYQPSWPLAAELAGVASADGFDAFCTLCGEPLQIVADEAHHADRGNDLDHEPGVDEDVSPAMDPGIVWLVASGDHPKSGPYAPREVWEMVL